MKHFYTRRPNNISSEHYAVSKNDYGVLVQLGDEKGEQVRLQLTLDEAMHFYSLLEANITLVSREQLHKRVD